MATREELDNKRLSIQSEIDKQKKIVVQRTESIRNTGEPINLNTLRQERLAAEKEIERLEKELVGTQEQKLEDFDSINQGEEQAVPPPPSTPLVERQNVSASNSGNTVTYLMMVLAVLFLFLVGFLLYRSGGDEVAKVAKASVSKIPPPVTTPTPDPTPEPTPEVTPTPTPTPKPAYAGSPDDEAVVKGNSAPAEVPSRSYREYESVPEKREPPTLRSSRSVRASASRPPPPYEVFTTSGGKGFHQCLLPLPNGSRCQQYYDGHPPEMRHAGCHLKWEAHRAQVHPEIPPIVARRN